MTSGHKTNSITPGKPAVQKIFGILNIILGLFGLIISISIAAMAARLADRAAGIAVAFTGLAVAIPMIAGGTGLLMNRNAGRVLSLAASYIALAAGIIYTGTIITALFYIYDQLTDPQRIKLIMRAGRVLLVCIYPGLSLFFLHKRSVRESMK